VQRHGCLCACSSRNTGVVIMYTPCLCGGGGGGGGVVVPCTSM
jgi:hypothetical protein